MRPIQEILGTRVELNCDVCGADLLTQSVQDPFSGNLVWATTKSYPTRYDELYVACKNTCDKTLQDRLYRQGFSTEWEDIGDLCNPILFLKNMLAYMNMLRAGKYQFSDAAHERMKKIYISLAQRTLREVTTEDEQRFKDLDIFDGII